MKVHRDLSAIFFLICYQFVKTETYLKNAEYVNIFSGIFFFQILNKNSAKPTAALILADLIREGMV